MNWQDAKKAVVRKYVCERSSRNVLTDEEIVNHIVAETDLLTAKKYGFASVQEMDDALVVTAGKWQDYMNKRSKHFGRG
jgi:hypothetical protein